jgi:hypothetical protein
MIDSRDIIQEASANWQMSFLENQSLSWGPEDIRLAAKRGYEMMQEYYPNILSKISRSRLMMQECTQCVLGQVFGDYTAGLVVLGFEHPDLVTRTANESGNSAVRVATWFGFDVPTDTGMPGYAILRDAWLELLEEKR